MTRTIETGAVTGTADQGGNLLPSTRTWQRSDERTALLRCRVGAA